MGGALMCVSLVYQARQETIASVVDCSVVRLYYTTVRVASRKLYSVVVDCRDSRLYIGW